MGNRDNLNIIINKIITLFEYLVLVNKTNKEKKTQI